MAKSTLKAFSENQLIATNFGEERCAPLHAYGPAVRTHYLIHYVASGCGVLSAENREYPVSAGQAFLIYPGEVTVYQADRLRPWHYAWAGYMGPDAETLTRLAGFSAEKRVLMVAHPDAAWDALTRLCADAARLRLGQLAALGGLYRFLALIAPEKDDAAVAGPSPHYEKALWFMRGAYMRDVSVQEIADFTGLSRSQLFRVFEKACGQSPKQALMELRLTQARRMLRESGLSAEKIAYSVGFHTASQLGAAFRARYGVTPGEYRRGRRTEQAISKIKYRTDPAQ